MKNTLTITLLALSATFLPACGQVEAGYDSNAAGLEALMADLQGAIRAEDTSTAASLAEGLFPSVDSIRSVLREEAGGTAEKIVEMHQGFLDGADMSTLFATDPARTEVLVHGADTADLAAQAEGTPAREEFPGGAAELARTVLAEGVTFYEVELVEPGEDSGMKYHLFFHDGDGWRMLGPAWRAL